MPAGIASKTPQRYNSNTPMFHSSTGFRVLVLLMATAPAWAQEAKPMEYTGKPLKLEFACSADDLQTSGLSCNGDEHCPVYLELVNVEHVGTRLFVTGNIHTEAATFRSVLLGSADDGKTWTEPFERIPGAGLDQVQFIDFETGWISGQLLGSPARDPFFVLTNDGGRTWRRRPIFSEPKPGSIEYFWFENRNSGTLLIDRLQADENGARHVLYESMTGGDTWALRQVSASPIPLKRRGAGPNPDWRVRPDGPTKSYRIEARRDGAWRTVAAFLVTLGECRAPEPALADTPPPTPVEVKPEETAPRPQAPRTPPTLRKKPN